METGERRCVVGSCCCGCSLRSGSLAIGITTLILGGLNLASTGYAGAAGDNTAWGTFAIVLIQVLLCIMLLYGINKERRGLIMIWVWVNAILLVIAIILAIVVVVLTANVVVAVILGISDILQCYFIVVIRSYALSLEL